MMRNFVLMFAVMLFFMLSFSCGNGSKPGDETEVKWSVRMAESTMARWDTLNKTLMPRPKWQYDIAMLSGAIAKLSEIEGDEKYWNYMKDFIDYYVQEDGSVLHYRVEEYNVDRIRPALSVFDLYEKTREEKYKIAVLQHVEQMKTHPRTSDGGYWHKNIYPHQVWLDGLYMFGPFLARYAKKFDDPVWFDEVVHQITHAYGNTVDETTGLLYHAYDESRSQQWADPETGRSRHFWGRAMGWYCMAIVDILDYLPENHNGRDTLISILNNVSEALLKIQDTESGLFYQVLDLGTREGNYLEASGSAMFGYTFAKGAKNGYLDKKYLDIAIEIHQAIIDNLIEIDEDGLVNLTNTVGGTGLGGNPYRDGSFEYYTSEKVVLNDSKGTGPFILLSIELDK